MLLLPNTKNTTLILQYYNISTLMTVMMQTYVIGDVLPIIQNIDRLIAKARNPVSDTSAWQSICSMHQCQTNVLIFRTTDIRYGI